MKYYNHEKTFFAIIKKSFFNKNEQILIYSNLPLFGDNIGIIKEKMELSNSNIDLLFLKYNIKINK